MAYVRDQAVVLRAWDFSETSQTVSLFTREHGIIRGLAKGARRERSAFSGGFEPLAIGEFVALAKPNAELATITEWQLRRVVWAARRSLHAHHVGLYLSDAVGRSLTTHDPHPAVFDAMDETLDTLGDAERIDISLARFHLVLLAETGYAVQVETDAATGDGLTATLPRAFVPDRGGFTIHRSSTGERWPVRPATAEAVYNIAHARNDIDPHAARGALRLLAAYLRWTLGRELPSARFAIPDADPMPSPTTRGDKLRADVDSRAERSDDSRSITPASRWG